jgi:hypothetical protein
VEPVGRLQDARPEVVPPGRADHVAHRQAERVQATTFHEEFEEDEAF